MVEVLPWRGKGRPCMKLFFFSELLSIVAAICERMVRIRGMTDEGDCAVK